MVNNKSGIWKKECLDNTTLSAPSSYCTDAPYSISIIFKITLLISLFQLIILTQTKLF